MLLSDVCLTSVAYIGPKSRTERPRKTKIGTEVAHMTRTPLSGSKGHQAAFLTAALRRGRCRGDRENVLGVGNYCYVASGRRRARRWGAHGAGEERGGDILCRHTHSLLKSPRCNSPEHADCNTA